MDRIIEALSNNGFEMADYLVFAAYIVILVGMGLFLSRTKKGEEKSSTDYFLAGNTLTWWAVGASLIAANISAEQFIGMSGSAFASGIAPAAYELMAAATLLVVGKFLLPLMIEKKIFTCRTTSRLNMPAPSHPSPPNRVKPSWKAQCS